MYEAHIKTNHAGYERSSNQVESVYAFEGLSIALRTFIKNCALCNTKSIKTVKAPLQPDCIKNINERWVVDYSKFNGLYWILVVVDSFSKFCWSKAYLTKQEKNVIQFLGEILEDETNGRPVRLGSDNGGEFTGNAMREFLITELIPVNINKIKCKKILYFFKFIYFFST